MVRQARGFSLLELMVVVAILGILMAVAVPAFTEWIAGQRVRDSAADLHTSLMRAKSEAVSRGLPITVARVDDSWAKGWTIANPEFVGTFIEEHGPVSNATISVIRNGAPLSSVTFSNNGRLSGTAITIRLEAAGTKTTRCITVDIAGRPKTRPINAAEACS